MAVAQLDPAALPVELPDLGAEAGMRLLHTVLPGDRAVLVDEVHRIGRATAQRRQRGRGEPLDVRRFAAVGHHHRNRREAVEI
ncbi:hypothetical protein ACIRG5_24150 [Lentzea sp. NPDC102401]|uniref:hypothetical protein n=1 Tax=Lentzea sp. NPDC102401 TaxID=3364128 RepID=UPI00381D8152